MATYRRDAEFRRYAQIRGEAYATVRRALQRDPSISVALKSIESRALSSWRVTWIPYFTGSRDEGEWNWDLISAEYLRQPAAFHLAIWSGTMLCGMAAGRPSVSHRRLTVHYVEGCPDPTHPLKGQILSIALAAATAYAHALWATTLRLSDPAPALIEDYVSAGFGLVYLGRAVRYCERRIRS
jgi:hypothetical protein